MILLKKDLEQKEAVIQKAYVIIEAQQQQIQELIRQQSKYPNKCNKQMKSNTSTQDNSLNISQYKDDQIESITFSDLIDQLLQKQIIKQENTINNDNLNKINVEIQYWQDICNNLQKELDKLLGHLSLQKLNNEEMFEQLLYYQNENKQLKQMIKRLLENDQNNVANLNIQQIEQHLHNAYSQFSQLSNDILMLEQSQQNKISKNSLNYQQQLMQLQQQMMEQDKFKQNIINILNLTIYDQDNQLILSVLRRLKQQQSQYINQQENNSHQLNTNSNTPLQQKLEQLITQWGLLFEELQLELENQGVNQPLRNVFELNHKIIMQYLKEVQLEQNITVKKLNGLNSQFRMYKREIELFIT